MSFSSSEQDLLMQCLDVSCDSAEFIQDLDAPQDFAHPGSNQRALSASSSRKGPKPDRFQTTGSTGGANSPPAAQEEALSRAFSTPDPHTTSNPTLDTNSASLHHSTQSATWLSQADAAACLLLQQASEGSAVNTCRTSVSASYATGPGSSRSSNQQQHPMFMVDSLLSSSEQFQQALQEVQAQQQQPSSATAARARAAVAAAQHQQRSASLDLLSPTAGHNLFPTLNSQPDPLAVPRLSAEQYQLLLKSGIDPTLAATAAAASTPTAADTQLDAAEALWQQIAASGADDNTLISLALSLGLITTDATGGMLLTREARLRQQQQLRANPLMPAAGGLQGLYAGTLLDPSASPRVPGASDSAPLPRFNQSALAGLLGMYSGMRLATASTPGSSSKQVGSPGPGPSKQHTLYKTELCRGWLESGTCRYGSKCQFAHGPEELRPVPRHPKYKTEVCRSFTATGVCAYGPRCRFIHGTMSAPNAIFEQPGSARTMAELEGLEGVLGFDDVSPNTGKMDRARGVWSPNHNLLASLAGGPSMALRQAQGASGLTQSVLAAAAAAANAPSLTAQDAAAMTRLGRLLSVPAGCNRTSLDSALSMAMARNALLGNAAGTTSDPRRNSMSDVPRSSLDSRGRTSIESSQSQAGEFTDPSVYTSPLKPAVPDLVGGGPHSPYMPGIPEGYAMTNLSHEQPSWPAPQQSTNPSGADVQQLAGQLAGFTFQASPSPHAGAVRQGAADLSTASGCWFSGGQWWNMAGQQEQQGCGRAAQSGASSLNNTSSGLCTTNSATLQSTAYSSGLYATSAASAPQPSASAMKALQAALPRGSNPGVLTPEKSEGSSLGPGSDIALAGMLGL